MLQILPTIQHRRRKFVANRILKVTHDSVSNRRMSVYVEGPLTNIMELGGAMEVSSDGQTWVGTTLAYYDNPPLLTLVFPSDISAANRWRIADAGIWHFENGKPIKPPLSGGIE